MLLPQPVSVPSTFMHLNPLKASDYYMYRTVVTIRATRFNIQQFYVLPTQSICVFCVDLRTNSDYFPIQH